MQSRRSPLRTIASTMLPVEAKRCCIAYALCGSASASKVSSMVSPSAPRVFTPLRIACSVEVVFERSWLVCCISPMRWLICISMSVDASSRRDTSRCAVARELARGGYARLQFLPHLPQLLRHRLRQLAELRVDLRGDRLALRGERVLHFLAHGGQLRVGSPARRPHHGADRDAARMAAMSQGRKVIAIHCSAKRAPGKAAGSICGAPAC